MHWKAYAVTITVACTGIVIIYPTCLSFILLGLLTLLTILLGVFTVIWGHLVLSPTHKTTVGAEQLFKSMEQFRNKLMHNYDDSQTVKTPQANLQIIVSKTVDSLLKQVLDFVIRDYILFYLKDLSYEPGDLCENIREDMWNAALLLRERLSRIDHSKLIACDIVSKITMHFEKIREAKTLEVGSIPTPIFTLSPHITTQGKELEILRSFSEILIMFLLPRTYSLSPSKYFIREVLACKVFQPTIDNITDPDFINRNIITYIETQEIASQVHVKAFEYSGSFEDFLKKIHKSDDVKALTSIRYNIVNKLMQATTIQNLNRAKGVDVDNDKITHSSAGINKADILAAKKLKKYITQLTFAKKECEKQLVELGWELRYQFNDEKNKVLSLRGILDHILGRKFLSQFLDTLASQDLVRYWSAVEELRLSQRKNWHQLGAEIFYTFIRNPTTEIKVDKNTRKRMEAFLLGDKGPEVFYEVQGQVVQTIEDKYYQPFLISDHYKEMLRAMEQADISDIDSSHALDEKSTESVIPESSLNVGDYSNYARRKLDQMQERCNNKSQALLALRSSLKPESKVLRILEKEVEWLQGEQRQIEAHISRTEIWGENLGKWSAVVQSAEVSDEKEPPQFVLVVHMLESDTVEGDEDISTGWVVCRSLAQFQELHRKLRPLCTEIRSLDLPSNTFKFLFGKTDRASLEKAKQQIQKYLNFVLRDDRLNQSEAIYSFLSPSSEHLKHSTPSPKKSRFSFSTLFKSGSEHSKDSSASLLRESDEEDISQCLDSMGATEIADFGKTNGKMFDDTKDTIAEPLYSLLSEIFDMRGVFKYLRKTLIGFVQLSYGRNINRQIHEIITWWFSEQMLHYYITVFLKNFWPGGTLAPVNPDRSVKEKVETRKRAKELFVNNVPELLTTLVGTTAAKNGAMKIFTILQEQNMNRQLFYEISEIILDAVFPELK